MMSKKQWFVVLCIFILYLLLGAGIFQIIESEEESNRLKIEKNQQLRIDSLLEHMINKSLEEEQELFDELSDYCGKPLRKGMRDEEQHPKWDFYHSLFFVLTVVSTIGYGNLAPTTMFTRLFMIFYSLIGIPMNGIVMVTLGTYFGRSFTKLYQRWKKTKIKDDTTKLGLISQIILYLVPGFTFFIFLPSALMVFFENWDYDVAVYYCYVSLTTIGFGDYVAGIENPNEYPMETFWVYKIFLFIWVIGGLGYVVMILGFITKALQSKKVHEIEQVIKQNIIKTPLRIRQELRSLLQEFIVMKAKRAHKCDFDYTPKTLERSQSCPDLNNLSNVMSPTAARQRAFSECPHHFFYDPTIDSETESTRQSFQATEQTDLLLKVVDALSLIDQPGGIDDTGGYDGFSDTEILASEGYGSKWSLKSQNAAVPKPLPKGQRRRAISDIRAPTMHKVEALQDITWYGQHAADNYNTFLEKQRTFSEPQMEKASRNLFARIKNKFIPPKDARNVDVEQNPRRASMFTSDEDRYLTQTNRGRASVLSVQEQEAVLEQTSIADFIRALSAITVPETMIQPSGSPKRKLGTAGLSPPKSQSPPRTRRLAIRPNLQSRRTSLMPDTHVVQNERRRLSLRPVEENLLAPPPYSPNPLPASSRPTRKFSRTFNVPSINISPVQRQMNRKENKDES